MIPIPTIPSNSKLPPLVPNYHLAAIYDGRRRPIAESRNRVGTRSKGCGYDDYTIHAERAVVKSLGDISLLRGCVLVVIRVNKQGEILGSKPCPDCKHFLEKCMKKYGLRKVVYS
jgi:hypothetical protein